MDNKKPEDFSVETLLKVIADLTPEQKKAIGINIETKKKRVTRKPTKKRTSTKKSVAKNQEIEVFSTNIKISSEEASIAKKLETNKKKDVPPISARQKVRLIKVKCKNCGRTTEVAENFPNVRDFICCIK